MATGNNTKKAGSYNLPFTPHERWVFLLWSQISLPSSNIITIVSTFHATFILKHSFHYFIRTLFFYKYMILKDFSCVVRVCQNNNNNVSKKYKAI